MHTEEEAKTKACCGPPALGFAIMTAAVWPNGGTVELAPGRKDGAEFTAKADAHYKRTGEYLQPRKGYCGLAGRPS